MQEQSKKKDAAILEEGLQQEKQEYTSKLKYNCCKQWIRYVRLIFLLELTLFFGWGCYMILQSYRSRVTENEATDITERYPPVFESVYEEQKSHRNAEMPVKFVKPENTDVLNNFLIKNLQELTKEQGKTIATDVDNMMQTSTQNSISILSNNMMEASDINDSRLKDLTDEEFMKHLMLTGSLLLRSIDKIITTDKDVNYNQFFETMQNIIKSIAVNDKQFKNPENHLINRLILNNQKDALDTSNEIKNLGLDVTTTSNLEDSVDSKINFKNFKNIVQNSKQRFLDFIEHMVQDDYGEKSFSKDGTDEQANAFLESDFVICPPYQSHESSDMSSEYSIKSSSTSQSASIPIFLEQIKNIFNDYGTKNKGKHDADDSNTSMSASSDTYASRNDEHFALDTIVQNIQDHHSLEMTNAKQEEEKLMKNIETLFNFGPVLQPKIQDNIDIESSTQNVKFQWFNVPPTFANNLQFEPKDISESSKTQNPTDTIEKTETINAFIPEKDKSKVNNKCQIEVKLNILRIKCPKITFDEEWDLTSSDSSTTDFSNIINFKDHFDLYDDYDNYYEDENEQSKDKLISNENSDKIVASLQHSVPKVIDASEFQESIPDRRNLENPYEFLFTNFFDKTEVDKHDAINSPDTEQIKQEISSSSTIISPFISESDSDIVDFNKESNASMEISDTQQQKQLKVTEEKDFLNSENAKTFLKSDERVYPLEKKVISIFNDEILNITKQHYPSDSEFFDENWNYICSIMQTCYPPVPMPTRKQFADFKQNLETLRKSFEMLRNHNKSYDIGNDSRKKRMVDDLMEQYEQVSNSLEEVNENENFLKKVFQKLEILAACIIRLHERHLLNNELDDDYISNEFSMETKEHRETLT